MKRAALLPLLCLFCWSAYTQTLPAWFVAMRSMKFQVGDDARWAGESWDDSAWSKVHWSQISSYDRILWWRADIDGSALPADRNIEVAVSIVGAYEIFWNGTRIGGSGKPAASRHDEVPGPMVSILTVPAAVLTRSADNILAVRVSSFHLAGRLSETVHLVRVGTGFDPMALRLRWYLPGIAASGALLLGAGYFGVLFLSNRRDRAAGYLSLLALAALSQFIAEASAAFVNYEYPVHLYRLWTILAMACVYGLGLTAYVTHRCCQSHQRSALIVTALGMVAVIGLMPSYDGKTALAIVVAGAVSFAVAVCSRPRRWLLLFAPLSLVTLFMIEPLRFTDEHFYLITAAAIILLFFEQVAHLRIEQAARVTAELRSARLELELLKSYIQPHFLLNTLTSLTEWVETDPKVGVRMIEALAEEFRVLSRVGSQRTIELRDEVALCQLHLQVMSLRHDVRMELSAEGVDQTRQLPPAILHTLIENALTHTHYPQGATFRLRESREKDCRCYELWCPPGTQEETSAGISRGTGLDYVRARLAEVFADRWRLTDGRALDGGWFTRIEVPV